MRINGFESDVAYYGFIASEFVQWELTTGGHLIVCTLEETHFYIAKDKWQHKRTFFGPGKVEFNTAHNGKVYSFTLKINALRERWANERDFCAGRNGPFNLTVRPLTAVFGRGQLIDPDHIASEIAETI